MTRFEKTLIPVSPKLRHVACGTVPNIHQHHNNLINRLLLIPTWYH